MLQKLIATVFGLGLAVLSLSLDARPALAQSAAPPTSESMEAARELLAAMGSDKQLEAVIPLMMQSMRQLILKQRPGAQRELDEAFSVLEVKFAKRRSELIDEVAVAYAAMVPLDDMRSMTAFFQSSAGQRFVVMQPELMRQTMAIGQRWGEKLGREVDLELQQELKKRGVRP